MLPPRLFFWFIVFLIASLTPLFVGVALLNNLTFMLIFIIYSLAWNFLASSGQGSLGHAVFYGLGGFCSAIIAKSLGLTLFVSVLVGIFVGGFFSALIGVLIGLTCIHMREWFLAMVTFGFSIIIHTLTTESSFLTGGHDGIPALGLLPVSLQNYRLFEYYILLFLTVIIVFVFYRIQNSKMGLALEAIRENELEAKVMGINVVKYKLSAFAISAFFAGVAGALEAQHMRYITPEVYKADMSFWPIIYSISGGIFTVEGPIVGTVVIKTLWDFLPQLGLNYERYVLIGLILILSVVFLPKGFVSLPEKVRERFQRPK